MKSIFPKPTVFLFRNLKSSEFVKLVPFAVTLSTEFLKKPCSSQLKKPSVFIFSFLVGLKMALKILILHY